MDFIVYKTKIPCTTCSKALQASKPKHIYIPSLKNIPHKSLLCTMGEGQLNKERDNSFLLIYVLLHRIKCVGMATKPYTLKSLSLTTNKP